SRPDKFGGTSLTGVQPYMGTAIPSLTGSIVFTDLAKKEESQSPVKGALAYSKAGIDGTRNDFQVIEINYDFGEQAAYFMSLGTNLDQTRLYLGVYGSMKVTDFNKGTIFEVVP
ncbi:TPA: glucose dehydrogenase, partial [Bacillus thuringiensis]|nr:glucose dehydrogenase [Bacillus thuringiensis]